MTLRTIFLTTLTAVTIAAQSIEPGELLNPGKDSWLTYHGDYSGRRHTTVSAITPENVANLQQVWKFSTGQNQAIKATPILVDGVMYITTPDNLWALDVRTAKELWHYQYPPNAAFHIGHRGAAFYKDTVYLTTPDCHLIALNAKDGKVKWDVIIADSAKGYWSTNSPLVVGNHVMVGISGDFDPFATWLNAFGNGLADSSWWEGIFYSLVASIYRAFGNIEGFFGAWLGIDWGGVEDTLDFWFPAEA